jgi:ketosteroid isomerase-like protein
MAVFTSKPTVLGTGPGEIWAGPEEVTAAYEEIFKGFDKGAQKLDYQYTIGDVSGDAGWLLGSGNVTSKKDGKEVEFPLNVSLTAAKVDGKWRIAAMHFSTLTDEDK